jgi:hypothetical protein
VRGVGGLDDDVQKLLVDDGRHVISALEPVVSLVLDTQFQPLHILVGLISGELEIFELNACGALELSKPFRFERRFLPLHLPLSHYGR